MTPQRQSKSSPPPRDDFNQRTAGSNRRLRIALACVALAFSTWLVALVLVNFWAAGSDLNLAINTLLRPEIRQSIWLSIATSILSTVISLWAGTAIAYFVSRYHFAGRWFIDILMDVPIFLPPLVIGISLLILFRRTPLVTLDQWLQISFQVPAVILVQSLVGIAFVYRTMKAVFDQQSLRPELIAATLGASRWRSFTGVTLPSSKQGLIAAAAIAWARAFGEFGPVLVFAGSFRGRTEVLPISVYLELNSGNLAGAAAVSVLMIVIATAVLMTVRAVANRRSQS